MSGDEPERLPDVDTAKLLRWAEARRRASTSRDERTTLRALESGLRSGRWSR